PNVAHPELLRAVPREEGGELRGIEMVGVVREPLVLGTRDHLWSEAVIAQPALRGDEIAEAASLPVAEPMRHEVELREPLRKHEGMVVGIVLSACGPARELTALLEGRIALPEELRLRYTHSLQGCTHRRPCSLAHADDLDVRRLDQRHREAVGLDPSLMACGDDPRGEPAGGPAPDDDDRSYWFDHYRCSLNLARKVITSAPKTKGPPTRVAPDAQGQQAKASRAAATYTTVHNRLRSAAGSRTGQWCGTWRR